jgi:hypothetical protein
MLKWRTVRQRAWHDQGDILYSRRDLPASQQPRSANDLRVVTGAYRLPSSETLR